MPPILAAAIQILAALGLFVCVLPSAAAAQTITEIIDDTGDGGGNLLDVPLGIAVDSSGNVYVTGVGFNNVFRITPGGTITEIIDSSGDGEGNSLVDPMGVAVDSSGNVYVTGFDPLSRNAFKITTPGTCSTGGTACSITEIIDGTGDGLGNQLNGAEGVTVDSSGNVYVTGKVTGNAFKIATPGTCSTGGTACSITEIIDGQGDKSGNTLQFPRSVAVDSSDNVYVTGIFGSNNAFKIAAPDACSTTGTPCTITEIIDDQLATGVGNTVG